MRVQDRTDESRTGNAPNQEVVLVLNRCSGSGGYPANWKRKFDCHYGCRPGRTANCITFTRSPRRIDRPRK